MLVDGLYGDTKPSRRDLGLVPRPFTAEAVRAVEGTTGSFFGMSLRLRDRRGHVEWLARYRPALVPALALAVVALLVQTVLALTVANVWYRMAVGGLVLSAFALAHVRLDWRALYRLSWRHAGYGVAAAPFLYAGGALVVRMLAASPALAAQIVALYGWKRMVPDALAVPLLLVIVLGEEIVWRAAVTLPLAARLGPWRGAAAAAALYALAHLPMGVPFLLLAAMGAGTFWSAFVLKARSAVPALVSHVLFDLAVLFWFPYVRA
jgi:membrane protease YdiL (CAAX protease family)